MPQSNLPLADLPLVHVAARCIPDEALSAIDALVATRLEQLIDGSDLPDLTASPDDADLYAAVRALVDAAYRQGLRDGVARLGELVE